MPIAEILTTALEGVKDAVEATVKTVQDGVVNMAKEVGVKVPEQVATTADGVNRVAGTNVLDKILLKQKALDTVRDWIKEINPNFDPFDVDSPFNNNCGSCAWNVFNRLEGNGNGVASAVNIGAVPEMEALTGLKQIPMKGPEAIKEKLKEMGPGAHAIIGVDRVIGPGHWFNAANINNEIVAIDGQTGEVTGFPPQDLGMVANWDMSMKV